MKFHLLALFTGIAVSVPSNPRKCGNEDIPSPEENARIMAEVSQYPSSQGLADTVIPVYFHIIMNANGTDGDLPSSAISRQISLLNSAYSPAGFRFETIEVDRTKNDEWFGNLDGSVWSAAGKSLRKGGLDALNIYSANLPDGTLGISQFPWDARNLKNTDGVRCATGTFPGGKLSPYNLGDTCVHEVGHWMVSFL